MTALNMTETARAIGLRYEYFRKIWRGLVAERGFPQPFAGHRWESEDVERWKHERSIPPTPPLRPARPRGRKPTLSVRDQAIAESRRLRGM